MSKPFFKMDDFGWAHLHRGEATRIANAKVAPLLEQIDLLKKSLSLTLDAEEKLEEENARLREALESIVSFDRNRGYPTGPEWVGLVDKIRAALGEK